MNGINMKKCFGKTHSVVQLLLIIWMTSLIHIAFGDYSATYLQEGESNFISIPYAAARGWYNTTLLQTNATNGFRVLFQELRLERDGDEVQIGTGNDPSDIQSIIAVIHGPIFFGPDDVFVDTDEMWFAAIGGRQYTHFVMNVDVTAIDLLNFFPCSGSNMNVSVTLVCDRHYDCDNKEDESSCNYSPTYLQEGESYIISQPSTSSRGWYNVALFQTYATNGFRVVFQSLHLNRDDVTIQIGTGDDPSDIQSVIATFRGYTNRAPDYIYIDTNEMWFAAMKKRPNGRIFGEVAVTAIDLLNLFPCSGSNMDVSVTLVCDGHYDCDNYEDELSCNYSAAYLQEGESYFISVPNTYTERFYKATLLQTNATIGFQVLFQDLYLGNDGVKVLIGTGNDPSDMQSVIATTHGYTNNAPDDLYLGTNEMWFAAIGGSIRVNVGVTAIDLLNFFPCSGSNISVSVTMVCDGRYDCDNYEDEISCNNSAAYLQESESHFISIPHADAKRFYNATFLQTNSTNGFRVVWHDLHFRRSDDEFQIGAGNDPSDKRSVIKTIRGSRDYASDVFVDTSEMWIAVIGGKTYSRIKMDVEIISIDLSNLLQCRTSGLSFTTNDVCDGVFTCPEFDDEAQCRHASAFLLENEYHTITFQNFYGKMYNVSLFKTNATNGFRVRFLDIYLEGDANIQIGTGNDTASSRSIVKTFRAYTSYEDNVYVGSNEMWIAVIDFRLYNVYGYVEIEVTPVSLSSLSPCLNSNKLLFQGEICDGTYQCDDYWDEKSCSHPDIFLHEGESFHLTIPSITRRSYNRTLLRTNSSLGFRVNIFHQSCCGARIVSGTGSDSSNISQIFWNNYYQGSDDVYVTTNEMWVAVIGGEESSDGNVEIDVTSVTLPVSRDLYFCSTNPNIGIQQSKRCDGIYDCLNYEDEYSCNQSAVFLQDEESFPITLFRYHQQTYRVWLFETNSTNGFRVDLPFIDCDYDNCNVLLGKGNDSTIQQSVIKTYSTFEYHQTDTEFYVDSQEIWVAVIVLESYDNYSRVFIDLSLTVVNMSGWFRCQDSDTSISQNDVCNGRYECDRYEDEIPCDRSPTTIREDESYAISNLELYEREYHVFLLQTNSSYGFHIKFQHIFLDCCDMRVQIGTGTDPSDDAYVVRALEDHTNYVDDFYVRTSHMWLVMAGGKDSNVGHVDIIVTVILVSENACLSTPCLNGGTCQQTEIGYQCLCMDPIIGRNCEIALCQNISWTSPRFEKVEFPVGKNGTWANSTGMCPFNTTQADEPIGRALCIGDGITQSQWQPVDNCGPFRNVTDILNEIAQVIVSEENAGEVSQQLSSVTSNIEDITSDDITFVVEITSNIVQQNLTSEEVTESLTSIASNIAQVETEVLEATEEEGGAISKFVQAFEEQISRVEVADGGMLNIQQSNVAVQVQSVPADAVMRGLALTLAGSSLSDLTKSNITINAPTQDNGDDVSATRQDIIAQVNIPPSVSSVISSTAPLSGSPSNSSGEYVRVNFNVFSTPALFISKSLRTISADNEGFNRSANSPVISLSFGQGTVAALTEFINFTFTTMKSGYVNPMCSFWDEEEEEWSQDGCVLVSGFATSDERYDEEGVRCACDHLTNFAVIMDIHRQETLTEAYNILTYIGCCISIFSLLVTLATYLWNKDLRTKQTNQIFICLCLTLLCLYTTFVIMISLDTIRDYREVQAGSCGFLAALVHYFVLSSIAWMGVEGYNTYLIIVKIFNSYIQNFMIKACLAAWGIPACIVVLTGAIARGSYAHDDLCFLQFWAQIGGLLIPMSIILLINIVIFILVVRQLLRSANITGRAKREAKVERRETIERVQNAICILLLLGLTWVTGYLLLIPLFSQVAQPIFVVLKSFQGFFIFLLYCGRKPHIRKKWGLTCFDKFLKREASTSSGVVSSTSGITSKLRLGASGSYSLSTKYDNPKPLCKYNPTFDASQVEEGATLLMTTDIQSSTEEQKKDTDRDATSTDVVTVSLPLDASVTKATKRGDDVSYTTDADTISVT